MEKKRSILFVEDDLSWARSKATLLRNAGYQVTDGIDTLGKAIKQIQKRHYDLALLDIDLRDSDEGGLKVAQWIRSKKIRTHIIFLTKFERFKGQAWRDVGIANYLEKPCQDDELLGTIKNTFLISIDEFYNGEINKVSGAFSYSLGEDWFWFTGKMIFIDKLDWIVANGSNSIFEMPWSGYKSELVLTSKIGHFEKALRHKDIMRINRQYIINITRVKESLGKGMILISNGRQELKEPVSRRYRKELTRRLQLKI